MVKVGDIGGVNIPDFTNTSGSSFNSGWSNFYHPDESFFTIKNDITIESVPIDVQSSVVDNNNSKSKIDARWIKSLNTLLAEPVKQLAKDLSALTKDLKWGESGSNVLGVATGFVAGVVTDVAGDVTLGKGFNWDNVKAALTKNGGKAFSGVANLLLGGLVGGIVSSAKKEGFKFSLVGLDKLTLKSIFDEKNLCKDAWDRILNQGSFEYLSELDKYGLKPYDALKPKQWIQLLKDKAARDAFIDGRKSMYKNMLKGLVENGLGKSLAAQMGVTAVFDYGISIASNIFQGLLEGKHISELLTADNLLDGGQLLKSVNKAIIGTAFRFIGYTLGCPKLMEVAGNIVASVLNNWICDYFTDENGKVDEVACAIAAGCELAGAVAGGVAFVAIFCASNPVGWVIGAGILVGAALGYFLWVGIYKGIVKNWDAICNWVGSTIKLIGSGIVTAVNTVVTIAVNFVNDAIDFLDTAATIVGDAISGAWDVAVEAWDDAKDWAFQAADDVKEWVGDKVEAVGDFLEDAGDFIATGAEAVAGAVSTGVEAVGDFLEDAGDFIATGAETVAGAVSTGVEAVGDFLSDTGDFLVDMGTSIAGGFLGLLGIG